MLWLSLFKFLSVCFFPSLGFSALSFWTPATNPPRVWVAVYQYLIHFCLQVGYSQDQWPTYSTVHTSCVAGQVKLAAQEYFRLTGSTGSEVKVLVFGGTAYERRRKAALRKSRCRFKFIMNKTEVTVTRKRCLGTVYSSTSLFILRSRSRRPCVCRVKVFTRYLSNAASVVLVRPPVWADTLGINARWWCVVIVKVHRCSNRCKTWRLAKMTLLINYDRFGFANTLHIHFKVRNKIK